MECAQRSPLSIPAQALAQQGHHGRSLAGVDGGAGLTTNNPMFPLQSPPAQPAFEGFHRAHTPSVLAGGPATTDAPEESDS